MQKLSKTRIYVEVTDACNLRCRSCVAWTPRGHSFMTLKTFNTILKKIVKADFRRVWLYWRGESHIHPKLPEMAEMAKKKGMQVFCPTSFASPHLSNEKWTGKLLSNLTRFRFDLDGYDQESLQKYRVGAKWSVVMKNLEVLSKVSATPPLGINMAVLMFRYNELNKQFFEDLVKKHNHRFKVAYISPTILGKNVLTKREASIWLAKNPKYRRYVQINSDLLPQKWVFRGKVVSRTKNHIWIHKSRPKCSSGVILIAVNGEVPCCSQDTHLKYSLGNIFKDSFKDIIKRYEALATKMYHRQLDICKINCLCRQKKNTTPQEALEQVKSPYWVRQHR